VALVVALNVAPNDARAGDSPSVPDKIIVPQEGSAAERTKMLWQNIRPVILADAKASLTDKDYLDRRNKVSEAWQQLEWDIAGQSSEEVSQFNRRVWMLIGDLYGAATTKPDYRQKVREKTKAKIETKLKELDEKAASLR